MTSRRTEDGHSNRDGRSDNEDVESTTAKNLLSPKRNAFSELMSPSKRQATDLAKTIGQHTVSKGLNSSLTFERRDGLAAYMTCPDQFPPSRVLYYNDSFVVIHDLYPKSSIHMLVIPRHTLTRLHPFEAFEQDEELLKSTKEEVRKVKKMAAAELRRRFGRFSQRDRARLKAMEEAESGPDGVLPTSNDLPDGRDWEREVVTGVHSGPSMNNLHVHVLSRDRFSECLKHRKHYNSFATPFLVSLDELPLDKGDVRRQPSHGNYLRDDMKCWRCGRNFRNKFQELKRHLDEEFEEWKKA